MEFKKNAGATTLYQFLTLIKWAGYIIAVGLLLVVGYYDVTNSWETPENTIGGTGFAIVGTICAVIAGVGWGAGKWRKGQKLPVTKEGKKLILQDWK